MPTNRNLLRRTLAFPVAVAALALTASSAAALPIGEDNPLPELNLKPNASLKVSPKVALVSPLLQIKEKKAIELGDLADVIVNGGDVVKFDASASTDPEGGALTYDFDLDGDGTYELTDEDAKQSKRYYKTGTFTVKVRVHDEGGLTDTDSEQLIIHAAPRAKLTSDVAVPLVGQTVNYDAGASTGDPSLVKYEWDLDGNGTFETNTGIGKQASASYQSPGNRTVKLKVTDFHGETSTTSLVTKVNQLPTAAFAHTPAVAGAPVQFDASTSTDDSAITKYEWDLDGNGSFETDGGATPTTTTTFPTHGLASVRLRVTDDLGGVSVVARAIPIAQAPQPVPGNGGPGTPQADTIAPLLKLAAKKLKLAKNGKITLKVSCPQAEVLCKGTVKLRTGGTRAKTIGSGKFNVTGGKSANVKVLLPASQRKAIRRGSKLNAKAIIAVSDAAGNTGTSTKGILIGL